MEPKRCRKINAILRKNKVGGSMLPDIKLLQGCSNKVVWYWHKNRHICLWNRRESPETNPRLYGKLVCVKGGKDIQWGKDILLSKCVWKTGQIHVKKNETDHFLYHIQKTNSKY